MRRTFRGFVYLLLIHISVQQENTEFGNPFKRRGASLSSLSAQPSTSSRQLNPQGNARPARPQGNVRPARQSGLNSHASISATFPQSTQSMVYTAPSFISSHPIPQLSSSNHHQSSSYPSFSSSQPSTPPSNLHPSTSLSYSSPPRTSPAVRFMLSRRQLWQGDPEPDSSETVIVKSLPDLSRHIRDPQRNSFQHRALQSEVFRGTVEEEPRSSSLIAAVQNILPEPIPAVPSLPVRPPFTAFASTNRPFLIVSESSPGSVSPTSPSLEETTTQGERGISAARGRQRFSSLHTQRTPTVETTSASTRQTTRGLGRDGPLDSSRGRSRDTTPFGRDKEVIIPTLGRDEDSLTTPLDEEQGGVRTSTEGVDDSTLEIQASITEQPKITTRRPKETLIKVLETTRKEEIIDHPELGRILSSDPCVEGNYEIVAGQAQRSFNHHLSVGNLAPVCDSKLLQGWYRFDSPAGNMLPTECPGGNYCGTQIPVWMKGSVPSVDEGIVQTTACINQDRECCVAELNIQVRNCSSWVSYYLVPTPGCFMGYCVGEGVPCPPGLASANGYTPCDFTVKMVETVLTQGTNNLQSEIIFSCNTILKDVLDPGSIEIEVMWFVEEKNVLSETFLASSKVSTVLSQEYWNMGQTIRCESQAKHTVVGARTEKKTSESFFAGIKIISGYPLVVEEGGPPSNLTIKSTVPVLCSPQDRVGSCCINLEIALNQVEEKQYCPAGGVLDRVSLPSCGYKICQNTWNSTHHVPIQAKLDKLYNGEQLMVLDIRTGVESSAQWRDYILPVQELLVRPAPVQEVCISDRSIKTFDSVSYSHREEGTFTLYRHSTLEQEVQVYYRRCNLRKLCHCAVSIRNEDIIVTLDICTRGYLQVWGLTRSGEILPEDKIPQYFNILSINDGRSYEVVFPSGTFVALGPYLSYIKVFASPSDLGYTEGLCGTLDRDRSNEFLNLEGEKSCNLNLDEDECEDFSKSWMVEPSQTLFSGFFRDLEINKTESNISSTRTEYQCACRLTQENEEKVLKLNEIPTSQFQTSRDLDLQGELTCSSERCVDQRSFSVLAGILKTAANEDLTRPEIRVLEQESAESQVATVTFLGGPVVPRPQDGWTAATAESFCADYIRASSAVGRCSGVPGVDVVTAEINCQKDVLYTGDSRYALLHLDRIKEDCRDSVTRNTSLWEVGNSRHPAPPPDIVDTLCINDCSNHGQCSSGVCLCAEGWTGADCTIDLRAGPRVGALGNNGLCDVRTRPCRNLIILGDNFANRPDLSCTFEVFKIRGVASKQLVQDLVITSPATFSSFQEITCTLPTLDIHSNKERHRFDLRDNTDQTRMFVKVLVHYGSGPRSHPLDLLLYDTQCWHCSITGECNAKSNNKCVFSAATTGIQTFRIGKSISNEKDEFQVCLFPHDSGGCDRKEFRYYYNSLERRCKLFVYGGCKGNQNNFISEVDCVRQCGDETALDDLTDLTNIEIVTQEIDQCSQVKDEGICPGNVPRFYFDKTAERCLLFSYGGCGGNTNNFVTEEGCISTCGGPAGALLHAIQLHGGLKPRRPFCSLSINRGGCQAKLRRFYFDSKDETCKLFVFGGCQGNENNFETMEDCVIKCGGPVEDSTSTFTYPTSTLLIEDTTQPQARPTLPAFLISTTPSTSEVNDLELKDQTRTSTQIILDRLNTSRPTSKPTQISFRSINLPSTSPCGLPREVGTCSSYRERYYFEPESDLCRKFRYSGCGGNGNNFMTGDNCVKNCGGKIEDFIVSKKHITERIVIPSMKLLTTTTTSTSTTTTTTSTTTTATTTTTTTSITTTEVEPVTDNSLFKRRKMKRVRMAPREKTDQGGTENSDNIAQESSDFITRARFREPQGSRTRSRVSFSSSTSVVSSSMSSDHFRGRRPITSDSLDHISRSSEVGAKPKLNSSSNITRTRTGSIEAPRFEAKSHFSRSRSFRHIPDRDSIRPKLGRRPIPRLSVAGRRIDEVVKAPPNSAGGLVVIRSFCRFPPAITPCTNPTPFYFYDVSSASCSRFQGSCVTSQNKFISEEDCMRTCIVQDRN